MRAVMAQVVAGKLEIQSIYSIIFRLGVLLCGVALILFYGMLMVGAAVNLPASWFGFLYCLAGIISGLLCFIYFFKKKQGVACFYSASCYFDDNNSG